MKRLRIAVVGCGAVARSFHLPVLAASDRVEVSLLVDTSLERARTLAAQYGVPAAADDYRAAANHADAAIVAVPHGLHALIATDLLRAGLHVLVEKPLALKSSDCDAMIDTAERATRVLATGLVRRFYGSSQLVKQLIESNILGDIVSVDLREGISHGWAVESSMMYDKDKGGGVLTGIGVHGLDLLLWWLGDYESVAYFDDAAGGVEAESLIEVKFKRGTSAVVEVSRGARNLRNTFILRGTRGTLEVGTGLGAPVRLTTPNGSLCLAGHGERTPSVVESISEVIRRQLDDFVDAIDNRREAFVSGREGKRSVALVEACYASRQPLVQPWLSASPTSIRVSA